MNSRRILGTLVGVLLLLALLIAAPLWYIGCQNPIVVPPIPPSPSASSATPPAPPVPFVQQADVADWCARQQNAGNWVFLGPDLGTDGTMVIPICYNPSFTAKVDRRISREGNILRVADGEASTATYVGPSNQPGGSTSWKTLASTFTGKFVVIGKYNGNDVRLLGDTLIVLLPPSGKPVNPYLDECADFRVLPSAPTDRWLKEVWMRCQLGTPRQTAVATTMIRTCGSGSCFSRDDGAALDARIRQIEEQVKKNGDKPVPPPPVQSPQQIGYDPSAPSR
jgi:hypothetical protein